ncbi:hypothetical protein [Paenibacillus sediminis]|nr:hypothetical protein [Paenibacillus sediminis]
MLLALSMLLYALPHISFGSNFTWADLFGAVWAAFALLVIGAHLHFLLGVNEETAQQLAKVRRAKIEGWQGRIAQDVKDSGSL